MRKTYFSIFIVAILALVISVSGCINQEGNQTNQSGTGTYSVNGLSFDYPLDWVVVSQTVGNTHIINIADPTSIESNGTQGSSALISSGSKSENVSYELAKESIANTTGIEFNLTEETVDVAGVTANMTTFTGTDTSGNQTQVKLIYFEKDNFVYIVHFIITGGENIQAQQQNFNMIKNSLQVP